MLHLALPIKHIRIKVNLDKLHVDVYLRICYHIRLQQLWSNLDLFVRRLFLKLTLTLVSLRMKKIQMIHTLYTNMVFYICSISQDSGESVNPFSGILSSNSDTHKRDNGKAGNSTTTEKDNGTQSSTVLSDTNTPGQTSETDGTESGTDTDEEDLKNVDISNNNAGGKTTAGNSDTTKGWSENGTESQDENRTGSGASASNSDNKNSDKDTGHTGGTNTKGRKRRDNLLMRALLLEHDIWKHMHDKHRVKY